MASPPSSYLLILIIPFSNPRFLLASPSSPPQRRRRATHDFRRMISELSVSCTTFNILAPIYKRLSEKDQSCRESQYRGYWLSRNERIIERLLEDQSSTICLQEVWLGNEVLVDMYEKRLGDAGYISFIASSFLGQTTAATGSSLLFGEIVLEL